MSRYAFLYFLIGLAILIFFFFLLTLYNDVRRDLFYKEKNKNCTYKNLIDKRTKEVRLWRIIYYCFLPTNAKMYYNCFFYFFFFLIQFATLVYFFYSIDCVWFYRKVFWKSKFFFVLSVIYSLLIISEQIVIYYEQNMGKINNLNIFIKILIIFVLPVIVVLVVRFLILHLFKFTMPYGEIYSILYSLWLYYHFPKKFILGWEERMEDLPELYVDFISNFFQWTVLDLGYLNLFLYFYWMQYLILIFFFCLMILTMILLFRNFEYYEKRKLVYDLMCVINYCKFMCSLVFLFACIVFYFFVLNDFNIKIWLNRSFFL